MKKILFGITSMQLGGAERVLVDIANSLCDKYEITIFTIYGKGEFEKELNKKIKLKKLFDKKYNEFSKLRKKIINPLTILLFKKLIYKKKIMDNYDVEIAFLEGPITRLFSIKNKNTKKIVWIHNDIKNVFGKGLKAKIKNIIDKKIYNKYDKLVFVSKDNLNKFNENYPSLNKKDKKVIYNYIDKEKVIEKSNEKINEKININFDENKINFVTVARLVRQKGIDRIIKVHKKLIDENLKHNFYVIGEGPEKEKLEEMIKKYKVEDTFKLLGKKENPYPYIKKADYFCLFSYFEGYGMVLEEAKILNKNILITDTAAREAVENYASSKIIENSETGIYEEMKKIINEKNEKNVEKSIEKVNNIEYNNKEILNNVIKLIES